LWYDKIVENQCTAGQDIPYTTYQELYGTPNESAYLTDPQYAECIGAEVK